MLIGFSASLLLFVVGVCGRSNLVLSVLTSEVLVNAVYLGLKGQGQGH